LIPGDQKPSPKSVAFSASVKDDIIHDLTPKFSVFPMMVESGTQHPNFGHSTSDAIATLLGKMLDP
jgi:hypothetical protein